MSNPDQSHSSIYSCDFAQAYANAKGNALRRYPSPDNQGSRLYPLVSPSVSPGFSIAPDDTIFAIGSCFARNIEAALHGSDMSVLSRNFDLGPIAENVANPHTFLNKYTAPSILNDLTWALERKSFPGKKVIYPVGTDRYADPQLGIVRLDHPIDAIMAFRERYLDYMAQVKDADVVILTLGYVEAWYDKVLGIYLNIAPPQRICRDEPDRFEFRVLGFDDVLRSLEGIHALLVKHRKKPLKMLITVSPVPLLSTFRDVDILVANAYSKSVQRAAVETFVADKPTVDYFPSYEFVTLSNPTVAWARNDYRHVSPDLVTRIMSNVLTHYVDDPSRQLGSDSNGPMTDAGVEATARLLIKLGDNDALGDLYDHNPDLLAENPDAMLGLVGHFEAAGEKDRAVAALNRLVDQHPTRPVLLQRLLLMTARDPAYQKTARAALKKHQDRFPKRSPFRAKIEKLL